MWLILIPSFESAAQCSTQQLLNRATFLWRVVPSSVFQLTDMRARITLWTFTWRTELRNLCFLPNYRGLAKFLVTSERNSSKAIADNPSSWKAVHLNIQTTSTHSSNWKSQLSENVAFLRRVTEEGQNPTEKGLFSMWNECNCFSKHFPSHSLRNPCHEGPLPLQ